MHGPKQYYLALGDSITYGYQAYKHAAGLPPSAFSTGYVDILAEHLREIQPAITVVNYGCPGESTRSFLKGPCLLNSANSFTTASPEGSSMRRSRSFERILAR